MALPPPHFKARKRFGQNFLVDDYIIGRIVDAINPKPGEALLEIGPGHAALTRPVLERAGALTAIELDRDLVEILSHDPFLNGLTLISGDALKLDLSTLAGYGRLRIFGNLPYNITSPILFHLLGQEGILDLHFMLQKEVVERLTAAPHNRDYGRLTVMAQFYAEVMPVLEVPPQAFSPRPKVTSAVVRLRPRALTSATRALAPLLTEITLAAFGERRKTLRNSLAAVFSGEEMHSLGIDPKARAENLTVRNYITLAEYLRDRRAAAR